MKGVIDMKEVFITTKDNPFNYFTQFKEWLDYDTLMGYGTPQYLARIAKLSGDLSDEEEQNEIESAIDSIIEWNGEFYQKVYKD